MFCSIGNFEKSKCWQWDYFKQIKSKVWGNSVKKGEAKIEKSQNYETKNFEVESKLRAKKSYYWKKKTNYGTKSQKFEETEVKITRYSKDFELKPTIWDKKSISWDKK